MEPLKLSRIATALNGEYNTDTTVNAVCIDTRKITPGCLFICIKGARFDAHQFANEALEKGAAAVMIDRDITVNGPFIRVADTTEALLNLGAYYRSLFNIPIVGLTGSVGKTTTKEFTYLVVSARYNAIKTLGNLNNNIGLPQMLLQMDSSTQAAVIEMGMNHFGEISLLSRATCPTVGVITNIGVSHIENLGSRDGILQAKLEICHGLKKGSPLILNGDDDKLSTVNDNDYKIYFFGINNGDFVAKNIVESADSTAFDIHYFGKVQSVKIPTIGIHNVYNALAAFAVGYVLNINPQDAADALADYVPSGMRQRIVQVGDITSIEDCYNASPDSMRAALRTLHDAAGNRKIAVLGDMLELGDYSRQAHSSVGDMVAENGIDYLFAYGSDARYYVEQAKAGGCSNAYFFDDKSKLSKKLLEVSGPGDAVLFKGSRGMKLEEIMDTVYKEWEN